MIEESVFYTGTLQFKEIEFTFAFNGKELRLIPPEDKKHFVKYNWGMKELAFGMYTLGDPISVEDPFLIGKCNETGYAIIFIPEHGSHLHLIDPLVIISLSAYIVYESSGDTIDRILFFCPEINYIHPVNRAITISRPVEKGSQNNGVVTVTTQNFDTTTTEKQIFLANNTPVSVYFDVSRTISRKINEAPLRVNSTLIFEFEATTNYDFIYRLFLIAREFIRFLCYRKNINMSKIELQTPCETGKHRTLGSMFLIDQDYDSENEVLNERRCIKQIHISGHEGEILSDIEEDTLYLRHLPESYHSGININAARFIMITSAFEWEFRRLYQNGVQKSDKLVIAEEAVSKMIQAQIDASQGKQRKIYKFLLRLVKADSLESEIKQIGNDFAGIVDVFGNNLYCLNGQELKYNQMGKRLAEQRNHFAHGDLDKDFIGLSLLDLIFLEFIIYAMQLKYYGIEDIRIKRAINELFHQNFDI